MDQVYKLYLALMLTVTPVAGVGLITHDTYTKYKEEREHIDTDINNVFEDIKGQDLELVNEYLQLSDLKETITDYLNLCDEIVERSIKHE